MVAPKLKKYLPIILAFILINSCGLGNKDLSSEEQEPYTIDIRSGLNQNIKAFTLADLSTDVKYITLETHDKALLRYIDDILIKDNYIFLSDREGLYVFDGNGKFIHRIGSLGNGPGEHGNRIKFTVDISNNEVIIYSRFIANVYDMHTADFKRSFRFDEDIFCLLNMGNNKTVLLTQELSDNAIGYSEAEVLLIDKHGKLINSISNSLRSEIKGNLSGIPLSYINNGFLHYIYTFRDTLYQLSDNFNRTPYAIFSLGNSEQIGKMNIIYDDINLIQYPDYLWVRSVVENSDFIFAQIQRGFQLSFMNIEFYKFIFDKKNKNINLTIDFENNLDGGLPFWPRWVSGDTLISFYLPFEILEHYDLNKSSGNLSREFMEMASELKEDDNPVLVLVKN